MKHDFYSAKWLPSNLLFVNMLLLHGNLLLLYSTSLHCLFLFNTIIIPLTLIPVDGLDELKFLSLKVHEMNGNGEKDGMKPVAGKMGVPEKTLPRLQF